MAINKGKREIEEDENIYYVSVESSLRMMNLEYSLGTDLDLVRSQVDLPCSMNHYVYAPGTTAELILDVCRKQYLQKYPYKTPEVWVDILLGEKIRIVFIRVIDDIYQEEKFADDYLDEDIGIYPEEDQEEWFDDEDYNPGWDR